MALLLIMAPLSVMALLLRVLASLCVQSAFISASTQIRTMLTCHFVEMMHPVITSAIHSRLKRMLRYFESILAF
jgi:hypothetical protein